MIVVDMQVEEVSLVDNPAYPDARITSIPYALEDLRKALGADFEPGVDVAPQGITINDVADVAHLRTIWKKEVRKVLRTLTFRDGNLAPDPIAYVGYEWGLEVFIQHLSRDLTAGAYVAEKAEIVRAAKTVGLSRPLAYLTVRDALVYRAITWLVRDDLTKGAREYVAFLRSSRAAQTI